MSEKTPDVSQLESRSNEFDAIDSRAVSLNRIEYDFSVDYNTYNINIIF